VRPAGELPSGGRAHLLLRIGFLLLGIALLYAPIALLPRLLGWMTGSALLPDVHRICLRMPFEWLSQPWMWPMLLGDIHWLIAPVVLPLSALLIGPLFCGWLCPAGVFTELLSRVVPDRFKLQLGGRIDPAPIRYGVLVGMFLSPYLGGYICCSFCNFTMMQALVSAAAGDFVGLQAWASFTLLTFIVWLFVLGLFVQGGRGWCNLICPAGAAMGLAYAIGAKRLPLVRRVQIDHDACTSCGSCAAKCPAWAIRGATVDPHACNLCRDCLYVCPTGAIGIGPRRGAEPQDASSGTCTSSR
jgi:ferredoxin-type protein NapH